MKEMIINFQKSQPKYAPLSISSHTMERVENIKFPGVRGYGFVLWDPIETKFSCTTFVGTTKWK